MKISQFLSIACVAMIFVAGYIVLTDNNTDSLTPSNLRGKIVGRDWTINPNTGKPWGDGWNNNGKPWNNNPNTGKPWGDGWNNNGKPWTINPNTGKPWGRHSRTRTWSETVEDDELEEVE